MIKFIRKFVSILMVAVWLLNVPLTVFAEEMPEQTEQFAMKPLPKQVGETKVVCEDENGILYVTLVDFSESVTRATNRTTDATFLFHYKTILGTTADAFEVKLSCDWIEDGLNSSIIVLNGNATTLGGGYTCTWIDSYHSQCQCWLELDVAKSGVYRFCALLVPLEDNPQLSLDYLYFGEIVG